jgi:Mrp family chromosome partitioning ATPase
MSNYFEALKHGHSRNGGGDFSHATANGAAEERMTPPGSASGALIRLPSPHPMPAAVARSESLRQLCERLSPVAVIDKNLRLLITGCRPGDGTSTVAAAFGIDLSQRLLLRTLLVDANVRRPTLHRALARSTDYPSEVLLDGPMQVRSTGWAWLDLATCCLGGTEEERREAIERCEEMSRHYAAVVIDLGVTRLDARMLPLARDNDPILLVARYGQTRRNELATTAAALLAAKRNVAGVVLNGATRAVVR